MEIIRMPSQADMSGVKAILRRAEAGLFFVRLTKIKLGGAR